VEQESGWIGWTVVLKNKNGDEFIAHAAKTQPYNILGRYYARTREEARAQLRACRAHGFTGRVAQVVVKATVYAE
jgi:hypothetical protein